MSDLDHANNCKNLFLTSLYRMIYEQECIEKKRRTLLRFVKIVDGGAVIVPMAVLAIITVNPGILTPLLIGTGFLNLIISAARYFSFYTKAKELGLHSNKISAIINYMDLAWRMYTNGLSSEEQFIETQKTLYDKYTTDLANSDEVYKWSDKDIQGIDAEAKRRIEIYLDNPEQINELLAK